MTDQSAGRALDHIRFRDKSFDRVVDTKHLYTLNKPGAYPSSSPPTRSSAPPGTPQQTGASCRPSSTVPSPKAKKWSAPTDTSRCPPATRGNSWPQ
ncbi:MAG: hypothetical protein U1U88_001885 [Lawsonella clevelandensis]